VKCIICQKEEAIIHPQYGILPGLNCSKGKATNPGKIIKLYEFTPESVKQSRKEYAKDILQASRDGIVSKERLDAWGERGLKLTKEQRENAQYVWSGEGVAGMPYKQGNPKII